MAPTAIFPFNIRADKEQNPAEQRQNLHPHRFHPHNCLHCDHLNHHYCIIITYQHHLGIVGIFLKEARFLIQSSLNFSNVIPKIDFSTYSRDIFFKPLSLIRSGSFAPVGPVVFKFKVFKDTRSLA